MHVVSVINYKGGVGKTTLTANLGAELAYRGYSVLLIDLDPQASLTFSFVKPDYWQRRLSSDKTIKKWYDSFLSGSPFSLSTITIDPSNVTTYLRRMNAKGRLSLIPSHLGLINVDLDLATELGGASAARVRLNYLKVHKRMAEGLADPQFQEYDLILIDCPPNFNIVTKTAIIASDHLLIPAKADYLSTLGIDYLQRSLAELVNDYNEFAQMEMGDTAISKVSPQILGVVFTMIQIYASQPISAQRPFIAQTKNLGVAVFDSFMRENKTYFGDAPEEGVPLVLRDRPRHIVKELESVASEFVGKLGI